MNTMLQLRHFNGCVMSSLSNILMYISLIAFVNSIALVVKVVSNGRALSTHCADYTVYNEQLNTGESKRTLKVSMTEHKRAVKMSDPNNGIAVHVAKSQHSIDWPGAKVVRTVHGYWEWRTMEAIEIRRSKRSMNLDKGLLLPSLWNPVLDQT